MGALRLPLKTGRGARGRAQRQVRSLQESAPAQKRPARPHACLLGTGAAEKGWVTRPGESVDCEGWN